MQMADDMDYHLARLLILLREFGRPGTKGLDGLTKLAKLDFLLRYPTFTDRLLEERQAAWPLGSEPSYEETLAVESRMIRYKYGPWDNRYYPLIGRLVGYGLAEPIKGKGRTSLRLTDKGAELADRISASEEWQIVAARSSMLKKRFNLSGSALKNLIYDSLPDAVDRPHWEEI